MDLEQNANPTDEMWEELKDRARRLVDNLEVRDFPNASAMIQQLNDTRDRSIYIEVGKLTRGLHDAIVNFDIDAGRVAGGGDGGEAVSKMANAQDRLDYVINLTRRSADKTMDMVEEGIPIVSSQAEEAQQLRDEWAKLIRREMEPGEFRELYHRIDGFLGKTVDNSRRLSEELNTILLAQDFQDLTGQVIRKVIALVQEVEDRLVELMRVAGQVEELTGIVGGLEPKLNKAKDASLDASPEGPQVKADQRDDVVSGQDDVDDLLSSLGF